MKIGLVGWRGMVGSVLVQRMKQEGDFSHFEPFFFSTSVSGGEAPAVNDVRRTVLDARSIDALSYMDVIVSCQGSNYTQDIYSRLRGRNWNGFWVDAASARRMESDAIIVLDPINRSQIDKGLRNGIRDFIGGNCSITLTLLGLAGLLQAGLVEWMTSMTYQAASGAGAAQVRELLRQMGAIHNESFALLEDSNQSILDVERAAARALNDVSFPMKECGVPLAGSIIPWIDSDLGNGMSREESKGEAETNKILGLPPHTIAVDGLCIRVGALRSHSAAVMMKLKKCVSLDEIEKLIESAHEWVELVPNNREDSMKRLTPAAVSGSLRVAVGRVRKMTIGDNFLTAMTVGDQLLWGAAEPLRRMVRMLIEYEQQCAVQGNTLSVKI